MLPFESTAFFGSAYPRLIGMRHGLPAIGAACGQNQTENGKAADNKNQQRRPTKKSHVSHPFLSLNIIVSPTS